MSVSIRWLGQAGFVVTDGVTTVAMDPFLSAHPDRQYDCPIDVVELSGMDAVLVSHEHIDHFDPAALGGAVERSPRLPVLLPTPVVEMARQAGLASGNLVGLQPGDSLPVGTAVIRAVAARHGVHVADAYNFGHELSGGLYRYLGFVVELDGMRIYHAGDTLDHETLADELRGLRVDVALLPVNGRDPRREADDLVGNLTAEEAADLAVRAGVRVAVPMHYDMFAANLGSPGAFVEALRDTGITVVVPARGVEVTLPGA